MFTIRNLTLLSIISAVFSFEDEYHLKSAPGLNIKMHFSNSTEPIQSIMFKNQQLQIVSPFKQLVSNQQQSLKAKSKHHQLQGFLKRIALKRQYRYRIG